MAHKKPARPAPQVPQRRAPVWLPYAALAALAIAVYANSLANGFIGDDQWQLLKNPLVTGGAIAPIFGSGAWSFLGIKGNYYRPVQFLLYLLLYEGFGFRAAAFHFCMVLLHAGNTLLVCLLGRRMASTRLALAAAVLFAVHPVHTEAVDWVAALPDLAVTTVVLAGVLLLARQPGAPRGGRIAAHCGLYFAALLTKETGVMLPVLYAGYGFFIGGRRWSEFRANAALYAGMAATFVVYLAMRAAVLGSLAPAQAMYFHLGPAAFVLSALTLAGQYLGMLFFPANLNYFHVFHATAGVTLELLTSVALLAAAAAIFLRSRTPLMAFGLLWMAVTVGPVLNLTGVGQNVLADRYLYLPSAGFCWIAGWAWDWLAERRWQTARAAGAAVLVLSAGATMARNRDWRDDFTMLRTTVAQSPDSGWVHDALASEYVARNALAEALEHETLAVRFEPNRAVFRRKLGYLLLVKDPRAALAEFRKEVELEPSSAQGHCDLGLAMEAAGDAASAVPEYRKALQLDPGLADAREGLARLTGR